MRVFMSAPFDTFSGYGWDACDIAAGLAREGVDVVPWPSKVLPGLPREVAQLLTKDPSGEYDVTLTFAPPFDIHPDDVVRLAPRHVGWSMWETSKITTEDMLEHGFGDYGVKEPDPEPFELCETEYAGRWWSWSRHSSVENRGLDLMLVTCPMNVEAFRAADPFIELDVLPCGVDPERFPVVERPVDRRMRFGMIGMLQGRKDPFLLLDAWRELKEEHPEFDAVLELKTSAAGLHPKIVEVYPDVVLHDRAWPMSKVKEWYQSIDVLVSVSRGEGNNKPAMEFMSSGGTVIASDWSGHQNWLWPDCAYPLRGQLMPIGPGDGMPESFRVDKEHLKETLLHCWAHRDEVARKGEAAARTIRQSLSWDVVCAKLARRLEQVVYG